MPFLALCSCGRGRRGATLGAVTRWAAWHRATGCEGTDHAIEVRCGCQVHRSDLHDIDDCLEAQADELAYWEDLRHEEAERYCPGCGDVHRFHDPCQAGA
jgi:hypothetical protein